MSTLHLHVQRPGAEPEELRFDAGPVVVGRSRNADVMVPDESVSRRHARLFVQDGSWLLEDLASRRGTLLNGAVLSEPKALQPGDVVTVGNTRLCVAGPEGTTVPWPPPPEFDHTLEPVVSVLRPASEFLERGGDDGVVRARLRLLNEVHQALARPISREELLALILDRAFEALGPEHGAIFLQMPDGSLQQAAERRSPASTGPLLVSRRLAEEVAYKGAAALVFDAQADDRFQDAKSVIASGIRSLVAAPLIDAEGCLGMIALYSRVHEKRFSESDLELLVSLAAAAALRLRNLVLVEEAARRQLLERELALAQEIQAGMTARRPPECREIEVAGRIRAARSVGGDLYDFLLEDDRLWFIVGDVAGKGMAAALHMAVTLTLFRAIAPSGAGLDEVMARINRELCRDNEQMVFVTALAGCLDLVSGRMSIANAGHNLPYLVGRDGGVRLLEPRNSLALGVMEGAVFPVTDVTIAPGDGVTVYTDGVCDATSPAGEAFGTGRLEACLTRSAPDRATGVVEAVFEAVDAFAATAPQEDDITVVVVRLLATRAQAGSETPQARA